MADIVNTIYREENITIALCLLIVRLEQVVAECVDGLNDKARPLPNARQPKKNPCERR